MTNETETHSDRSGVTSRRISPWVALIPAGAVAVLLTLGTPLVLGTSDELPSQFVGEPAPPMAAVSIDGLPPVTDALLRTGELTLVNFWASWCGPCRVEHPNLEALANEGLRIVGLNYKDPDPNARAFLDELGNPYVAVGSVDGRTAIEWGVYGVPETFLVTGEGTVIMRAAGPITDAVMKNRVRPALKAAGHGG